MKEDTTTVSKFGRRITLSTVLTRTQEDIPNGKTASN